MNVLIVTEKPSVTRCLAPFARKSWPDASVTFVHAVPYVNIRFAYPRGLKMREFPFLAEPGTRLVPWEKWSCQPATLAATAELLPTEVREELFTSADVIVSACDVDHTGANAFATLLEHVFGDTRYLQCPALSIWSLDDAAIETAFKNMAPFGEICAKNLEYGRIKRYFDWNWNVNSLAIFGETQAGVGVPLDAPPMSKYALQLLYALRDQPPMTAGAVVQLMHRWPGTGRYQIKPGQWHPQLGSAASRSPILDNLSLAGLLSRTEVDGKTGVAVSPRGYALLEMLHPDCEDPDLPYRLHAWCEQGFAAKPAINRYINTLFGKQKRFLGR
ncbi:hypothetical protein QZN30_05430 [Burkholderia multivorans]|jgi:hypothetical protein|nr:hypothetical protein [Burkholderia multivorans]